MLNVFMFILCDLFLIVVIFYLYIIHPHPPHLLTTLHNNTKFLVIDLAVAITISFADHFQNLLLVKVRPQNCL